MYTIEAVGGTGASASYFKLGKAYSHQLGISGEHFSAYNMVYGPFGGAYGNVMSKDFLSSTPSYIVLMMRFLFVIFCFSKGQDLICVQSLDGVLQFFEHV